MQSMEFGKTPGIYGISSEFHKAFWAKMGSDLINIFKESLTGAVLT